MFNVASFIRTAVWAGAVTALVAGAACEVGAPSVGTPQAAAGATLTPSDSLTQPLTPSAELTAEPTPTPDAAAVAIITAVAIAAAPNPAVAPNPAAALNPAAVPSASALLRASPAALPTPVPPSEAVGPAATDLDTKLSALSAALKTQDVNGALKLQRALLASCDTAETALKNDKSTPAQAIRAAIADIRSSATGGEANGYEHAAAALRQVVGGSGSGLGLTAVGQNAPTDTTADLHTIADQVRGMRQAVVNKNAGEALRLQAQLMAEIDPAQKAVEKDETDQGKAIKGALSDLQKGLDGDPMRLSAASAALDKLAGPTVSANASSPQVVDMSQSALSLTSKIDAFRAAASTNSQSDLLRLQSDILTEVDQDSAAVSQADQSPATTAMKQALDDVRNGVSGDLSKLDGARANLAKVAGQVPTASAAAPVAGGDSGKPIADLSKFAADLDGSVSAFQAALQKNDTGAMLRLKKQLSDQTAQADVNLKDAQSKPADEVRAAVASVRTAFAGDLTKLDEAHTHLRNVTGTATAAGAGTGAGTAAGAGTGTAAAQAGAPGAPAKPGDVVGVATTLRDKVAGLGTAVRDHQSPDELSARRAALIAAAAQAESALNGVTDPRADRLRSAIGMAREAAGGDDAKVASAQAAVDAAVNGQ